MRIFASSVLPCCLAHTKPCTLLTYLPFCIVKISVKACFCQGIRSIPISAARSIVCCALDLSPSTGCANMRGVGLPINRPPNCKTFVFGLSVMSGSYWFRPIDKSVKIGTFADKSTIARSGGVDCGAKKTPLCPSLSDLSRLQRLQIAARFSGS